MDRRGRAGHTTWSVVIAAALCLGAVSCGGSPAPAPATNTLHVTSCTTAGRSARCGTLAVAENRLTGHGRRIEISFVIIPATGQRRAPDPVVYFAGGPGGSAIGDIPAELPRLAGLNQDRDLVFIDQRGTGGSGLLGCSALPGTLAGPALVRRGVRSCLDSLRGHAELRFYTSAMAAGDVAQVLTALGYGRVDLFGGSYGATAAQVFQQLFPGRVRTMTLLSGTLLSVPLFERFPQASQQALDRVLARCASDPRCHGHFPRLAAEWARLRASVAGRPVTLPARQSPTGAALRLDASGLADAVHQLLMMSASSAAYLPLLIHTLATARSKRAAVAMIVRRLMAAGLVSSGRDAVISYPIRCAEPWARLRPGQIQGTGSYLYPYWERQARWWRYVCTLIPAPGPAARYGTQQPSAVPVLMINGTADPQDPPVNMSGARDIWPKGRLLIAPGQAHGIDSGPWQRCEAGIVRAFVEHASTKRLDAGCLSGVALPAFPVRW